MQQVATFMPLILKSWWAKARSTEYDWSLNGLRWEAKNETAYPSTFVIEKTGKVRFSHVSKGHGDRVSAADAVRVVGKLE